MPSKNDSRFDKLNLGFDFLVNSPYKLYCCRTNLEKRMEDLNRTCSARVRPSTLPSFVKLKDSKNLFYNSICSIKHLYEQNKQKIERTVFKLKEESEKADELLEAYSRLFVGTWSLLYIEYVLNKFLSISVEYEKYLNKAVLFSDRYSTYTDVLSYYLSLTNVYDNLTSEYYNTLDILDIFGSETSGKTNEISSHLLRVISTFEKHEKELSKVVLKSRCIRDAITKLQNDGYNCSFKYVKTKYYVDSLLDDIIDEGGDKSIKYQPFPIQINAIRNKIVLLRILVRQFQCGV